MPGLIYRRVFEDWETLDEIVSGGIPTVQDIKRRLFVIERRTDAARPDHYYKGYLADRLGKAGSHASLLREALCRLADTYLFARDYQINVRPERHDEWQNLLPFVSPLIVMAACIEQNLGRSRTGYMPDDAALRRYLESCLPHSSLPLLRLPLVDDLIEGDGLQELHMHLTGGTELDVLWLSIMENPNGFLSEISRVDKPGVKELYEQVRPGLTALKFSRYIRTARRLRWMISESAFNGAPLHPEDIRRAHRGLSPLFSGGRDWALHPLKKFRPRLASDLTPIQAELAWHTLVLRELGSGAVPGFASAVHAYLLSIGMVAKLSVQQVDQFGFDQFQKFTWNGLREDVERSYRDRFAQLTGPGGRDIATMEGRFAPKKSRGATARLLKNVLSGFERFRHDHGQDSGDRRPELKLVAHFIKEPDKTEHEQAASCRHFAMRRRLVKDGREFMAFMQGPGEQKRVVVGIDAAANELHAPPEVFAPLFRTLRHNGFSNVTFHAGEDFEHLVSGIRAVAEAVCFLDMQSGHRIGHATAIGVDPSLWQQRIGPRLMLRRQDYLDNLVFIHSMLLARDPTLAHRLEGKISDIAASIHGRPILASTLHRAWKLRFLDPLVCNEVIKEKASSWWRVAGIEKFRDHVFSKRIGFEWRRECALVLDCLAQDEEAVELFTWYHSFKGRRSGAEWVEVDTLEVGREGLVALQHAVIELLNQRGIGIETLPTSNVRISVYDHYADHHLFRWLGLREAEFGARAPRPLVCVGSDDPGIFATNLRNEFNHLFLTLVEHFGLSPCDARAVLDRLNQNGRALQFKSMSA